MKTLALKLLATLRLHWPWLRWALVVLAVIFAVLTFTQATSYLAAWYAQRSLGKKAAVLTQQQQAAVQRDQQQQRAADSLYFTLQGQAQAAQAQTLQHQHRYDSLAARLPVPPVLPASPPRYRAGAGRR